MLCEETKIPKENISLTSQLASDLGIDSLQKVELICAIERKLNIRFPEEKDYEISTFGDLVKQTESFKPGELPAETDWDKKSKGILIKKKIFLITRLTMLIFLKLFFKFYLRLKISGQKNIPADKSFIIAANHTSHLDMPLVFCSLPLTKAVNMIAPAAKDYFYRNALRRIIAEPFFNIFPFERAGNFVQSLKLCKILINKGNSLILFPEGTRSVSGEPGEFKPGIGSLAYNLNIPIIPVYIKGAHQALPKGAFFIKPCHTEIKIGEPIEPYGEGNYEKYKDIALGAKEEILKLK